MRYSWKQLGESRPQGFRIPFIGQLIAYIRTLAPGDQFIAGVLGVLVAGSLLAGVYGLERMFLVSQPGYGGSFTEGVVGNPRFVNPLLALSDSDRDLVRLTYAGLMQARGDGTLVPVLAESYTVSEDGKIYTFLLREHATFSDGSPVTAEDVVYTVGKAQDPGLKSPELANWSGIRAEAIDARTVRFTLPRAYSPFLEDTTLGILPAHLWKSVTNEEFPFSPLMTKPVGAGPFKTEQVTRDKAGVITGYTLRSFGGYALGRAYLDEVRFQFFEDESAVETALESGSVDSAYGIALEGAIRVPYARIFGVFLNATANPAFSSIDVRKALSLAVNREAIVTSVLGGYATALNGPVPPGSGIETTAIPQSVSRIEEAAGLLEKADWAYDEEARVWKKADGQTLRTTLRTSNVPELKLIAQQVQSDWAALGVPTALELYEPGDLTKDVIRPRQYEALLFGMVVGRDRDLYAFWHAAERSDPGLNISLYSNSGVDTLLERYRTESDPAKRLETLASIEKQIASDVPAIFTHAPDFVYAVPSGMQGIALSQIASPSDRFADIAHWYQRTEEVWPFLARRQ